MGFSEFDLINRYFNQKPTIHHSNLLGIGDDCALISVPSDQQLAVTTDTMVENVHFFADVDPELLGHKLLAVNLSDLAAMGALPFAVTLAITLPEINKTWLAAFSKGFFNLAECYNVDLIGGDTTSGPLTLTVQAFGQVPNGKALLRSSAKPGDLIYVTGEIGNAGLGLKIKQGYRCQNPETMLNSFNKPQPRVELGIALRGIANACIDISDGLAADLGHILDKSKVGACLVWDQIPLSAEVKNYLLQNDDWQMPLRSGDDYELCFTVPAKLKDDLPYGCICIGLIEQNPGLRIQKNGILQPIEAKGFEHFS